MDYLKLWDKQSPIIWYWKDLEDWTIEVISKNNLLPLDEEIILYQNGHGETFYWKRLSDLKGMYDVTEKNAKKAFDEVIYRMSIPKTTQDNLEQIVLELSYSNSKKQESVNIISLYADGTKTDFIPDATAMGTFWAQQIVFNKIEFNQIPIQYQDEVKYRLENNILN